MVCHKKNKENQTSLRQRRKIQLQNFQII
jgi:hypothetical protein